MKEESAVSAEPQSPSNPAVRRFVTWQVAARNTTKKFYVSSNLPPMQNASYPTLFHGLLVTGSVRQGNNANAKAATNFPAPMFHVSSNPPKMAQMFR